MILKKVNYGRLPFIFSNATLSGLIIVIFNCSFMSYGMFEDVFVASFAFSSPGKGKEPIECLCYT